MKKMFLLSLLLFITSVFLFISSLKAQVGIGTSSPEASSVLDLSSTSKGMLVPRMTAAQKNAISNPATGLLVYQNDSSAGFYFYKASAWIKITNSDSVVTVGAVGSSSANGASINSGVLTLTPADAVNPGIVTTGTQSFAGAKTFSSDITVNGLTVGTGGGNIASNTAVGSTSLSVNTTGTNNTALGANANVGSASLTNATAIGYGATVTNSNSIQLGNTSVTRVKSSGTWVLFGPTVTAINSSATATAASIVGGYITSSTSSNVNITLPSATAIATELGGTVKRGTYFEFTVQNTGTGTNSVILNDGTGITVLGTTPLLGAAAAIVRTDQEIGVFRVIFTSATAAYCVRVI